MRSIWFRNHVRRIRRRRLGTLSSYIGCQTRNNSSLQGNDSVRSQASAGQIENMTSLVKSLSTTPPKELDPNLMRQAFLFWLSRSVREVARKQGREDVPRQCAQKILDACMESKNVSLIEHVVRNPASCNAGFDRLQAFYLEPLQGTQLQLQRWHQRKQTNLSDSEKLECLYKASKVRALAEKIQQDPNYPNIVLDEGSCEATMNLWSKRCQFFTRSSLEWRENVDPEKRCIALGNKNSSQECIKAMFDFVDERKRSGTGPQLGPPVYGAILTALSHSNIPGAENMALELLQRLENDPSVTVTIKMFAAVLLTFRQLSIGAPAVAAEKALEVWNSMRKHNDPEIANSLVSASIVMTILSRADRAQEAEDLLDEMEAISEKTRIYPTSIHYNVALHAWAVSSDPDSTERVRGLLSRMETLGSTRPDCKPSIISYTSAMTAYIRSHLPGVMEQAEQLLLNLENSADEKSRPDPTAYKNVIASISARCSKEPDWGIKEQLCVRLENVLNRWCERAALGESLGSPDLGAYKTCLHAWATSHSPISAEHALRIYNLVKGRYKQGDQRFRPDSEVFELLMKCINKSENEECVDMASGLREEMRRFGVRESMTVLGLSLRIMSKRDPFRAQTVLEKAERDFQEGKAAPPNEACYLAVIRGFADANNGALHARRILDKMAKLSQTEGRQQLRPSASSYLALVEAWGKSGDPRALEQIELMFEKVVKNSRHVSAFAYSTYQEAVARTGTPKAVYILEESLCSMQQDYESGANDLARPVAHNFAILIDAWRKSEHPDSAQKAEAILKRMEDLYRHSPKYAHLKPIARCYVGVIAAFAQSEEEDACDRALAILENMQVSASTNPDAVLPNRECFGQAMLAVLRSSHADKAERVERLLQDMILSKKTGNTHAEPNEFIYSLVFRACEQTASTEEEARRSLDIANRTLQLYLESGSELKSSAFRSYLQAIKTIMSAEERKQVPAAVALSWPRHILDDRKVRNLLESYESYQTPPDDTTDPEIV